MTDNCIFQATDDHMNMILEDVEEITTVEQEVNGSLEVTEVFFLHNDFLQVKRNIKMLYLRGDNIILVSPPRIAGLVQNK